MELRSGKVVGRKHASMDLTVKHWLPLKQRKKLWEYLQEVMKDVCGQWYASERGVGKKSVKDCDLGMTQAYVFPFLSNQEVLDIAHDLAKRSGFCKINVFYYTTGREEPRIKRVK